MKLARKSKPKHYTDCTDVTDYADQANESLQADVFVPKIGMLRDEGAHQGLAFQIIHIDEVHTGAREELLGALKVGVLADDDGRDFEQQGGAGTHHAWTQRAHQHQAIPIPPAAGIADAHNLGVCSRISGLDAQVVSARHDFAIRVRKDRSDRQPAFIQAFSRLSDCFEKKLLIIHVRLAMTT